MCRVLNHLVMGWLSINQRHKQRSKCQETPRLGLQTQIDVKFIALFPPATTNKHNQLAAVADCTSIRTLCVYPKNNQEIATQLFDHLLERLSSRVNSVHTDDDTKF